MRARSLLVGILVAACLVAPADVSWAGNRKAGGHPWTGTGNHDGRWNQPDRADWNGHGRHEGWLNQRDRHRWQGNPPRGSCNDDRDDRGQHERFQPPWGGPLIDGRPSRGPLF